MIIILQDICVCFVCASLFIVIYVRSCVQLTSQSCAYVCSSLFLYTCAFNVTCNCPLAHFPKEQYNWLFNQWPPVCYWIINGRVNIKISSLEEADN